MMIMQRIPLINLAPRLGPIISCLLSSIFVMSPSQACSPSFRAVIQEQAKGEVIAPNAVFRSWHFALDSVSAGLFDAKGRRVAALLTTSTVPISDFLEEPFCSELRPIEALVAGDYEYRIQTTTGETQKAKFTVSGEPDKLGPLFDWALTTQQISANVELEQVSVGVRPNCSGVLRKRPFVVVNAESVLPAKNATEPLIYEISWAPVVNGLIDHSRRQTLTGLRPPNAQPRFGRSLPLTSNKFLIPVSFFRGVKPEDEFVQVSLFAVNRAGNKSQAVNARFPARRITSLNESETQPPASRVVPIDIEVTKDLHRLRSAAMSEVDKEVFDLLQPMAPYEEGEDFDAAFKHSLLAAGDRIFRVEATVPADKTKVTVHFPVSVHDGIVKPIVTKLQMSLLMEVLPLEEPNIERVDVLFSQKEATNSSARVGVYFRGQAPRQYVWSLGDRHNIKASVQTFLQWEQNLKQNAFYQAMVGKHGKPTDSKLLYQTVGTHSPDIETYFLRNQGTVKWRIRDGLIEIAHLSGYIEDFEVGEMVQPFHDIGRLLELSDQDRASARIWLNSNEDDAGKVVTVHFFKNNELREMKFSISSEGVVTKFMK